MNVYRFKLPNAYGVNIYQKCKDVHAAREYAKNHGYELCKYADPDREFFARCFHLDNPPKE